ncbi:MAG: outer membrane lipoprotein-sorting protein [Bacteroidetes bacterium]|nr:MAG: outer membrane lipoprotein-sorting protein [Bacteroidota bacterium]
MIYLNIQIKKNGVIVFKKIIIILAVLFLISADLFSQNVDEIINKTLQNQGNEKLKSIKSMKISGKISGMGTEIPFKMFFKQPKSIRSEIDISGKKMIQAFDGKTGWFISPQSKDNKPEKMPDEMLTKLKVQSNFLESPFNDYKKKGINVKLLGKSKVDGKNAYKLKLTMKDKQSMTVFIDADKYVFFKTTIEVSKGKEKARLDTYLKNHKNINGILIPFTVENHINGKKASAMQLENVETDTKIDDNLFKMPK